MDHPPYKIVSEQPTLLILKDYCLMKIFKFLELDDFISVHNTCMRLRNVSRSICALKYKKIIVSNIGLDDEPGPAFSKQEFVDILTVIETHVLTVEIRNPNQFIIETIRDRRKNITSLTLLGRDHPFHLQGFQNLKELTLCTNTQNVTMNIEELKNCFENNPDLESVDFECWDNIESLERLIQTLTMLPKLKTLVLPHYDFFNVNDYIHHLLRLDGLTELTFCSYENCIQLLTQLSKNLNLKELCIYTTVDNDIFRIMKLFLNVEFLTLVHSDIDSDVSDISDTIAFPPKLKHIWISNIRLSCATFLSIVKPLKFLRKFTITEGDIYSDRNKSLGIRNSKMICRIANALRGEIDQPILEIVFRNRGDAENTRILYNLDRLVIVDRTVIFPQSVKYLPRTPGAIYVDGNSNITPD